MLVFVILLFVPLALQHIAVGKDEIDYNKKNIRALFIFFLLLTILVMLRHESVGNDTRNYIYYFKQYSNMRWSTLSRITNEIGFAYYNKIISVIANEPQIFLAITAIITTAMIYPTYKRLCTDPALTIIIFVIISTFVMMFSGIRQMLAIAIGFIAYEFTRNKKLIPFIICLVVALTIHTSAFMLAFMYPLYHTKITKKWLAVVIPVIGIIFIFNKQIFFLLGILLKTYTEYDASISETGAYTMLILFIVFAVFAYIVPDESKLNPEIIGLRNFLLISVVLQMFAPLNTLAMRMNYYYIIFIPLLLPKIIDCKSESWAKVATVARHIMIVVFLAYFFLIMSNSEGTLHVFPYHFFWENV